MARPRAPRRRAGHTRVFVYGTLRTGERNHDFLAGAARVAADRTPARYTLVDLGAYPAAVVGGATAIVGEVFEVDAATLARLDRLEGHPHLYQRMPVRLTSRRIAVMYVMAAAQAEGGPAIAGGDWLARPVRRGAPDAGGLRGGQRRLGGT